MYEIITEDTEAKRDFFKNFFVQRNILSICTTKVAWPQHRGNYIGFPNDSGS